MNQKYSIVEIEGVKNFDLNDPNQAIDFLIYILNKESLHPRLTDSIIKQMFGFGLTKYTTNLKKSKNLYLDSMLDINEFFQIFISDLEFNNIFYKYFVENKDDSDLTKKQKADSLLLGLKKCIDYLWEMGSISTIDMYVEEKLSELHSFINSSNLYSYTLPTYHIYKNLKNIYDIFWNQYSTFVDTTKHEFSNTYSNNPIHIEEINTINEVDNSKGFQLSRANILKKLIDGSEMLNLFENYEKKLISQKYLSENRKEWLKKPANFIRFYNYCESKNIFFGYHSPTSKGVKLLRDLYGFTNGLDLDPPSKRILQNTSREKGEFNFLNII